VPFFGFFHSSLGDILLGNSWSNFVKHLPGRPRITQDAIGKPVSPLEARLGYTTDAYLTAGGVGDHLTLNIETVDIPIAKEGLPAAMLDICTRPIVCYAD
jgi:hypothetical protein